LRNRDQRDAVGEGERCEVVGDDGVAAPSQGNEQGAGFRGRPEVAQRSGLWRFAYRFGGKQTQIALGAYPEVTRAEARDRREAARKVLASGKDPSVERRLEKIASSGAAEGAVVGAVVGGGVGAAVGAAVGAVVGAIGSLFD